MGEDNLQAEYSYLNGRWQFTERITTQLQEWQGTLHRLDGDLNGIRATTTETWVAYSNSTTGDSGLCIGSVVCLYTPVTDWPEMDGIRTTGGGSGGGGRGREASCFKNVPLVEFICMLYLLACKVEIP